MIHASSTLFLCFKMARKLLVDMEMMCYHYSDNE